METAWQRINHPRGFVTRGLRRASQTAVGTYAAYVVRGLLRPDLMRPGVTNAERAQLLPGDDLVPDPSWVTDFAIDIAASRDEVWPWLVQIGYGRAGWYTWFPLDNNGVPSADAIVPALQSLAVGDIIPDGPRARDGFGVWYVRTLDRPCAMVLESRRNPVSGREIDGDVDRASSCMHITWVFALTSFGTHRCRLHVRVRARLHGKAWALPVARAARLLFGVGDNVMENTMLEGIRTRAEAHAGST